MNAIDIDRTIENLAQAVGDQPSQVRIWVALQLAAALGFDAIITATDDPVEALLEVGTMWADRVPELLEREPHRQGETFKAAHAVVQRLLRACPGAVTG